MYSRRTRVRTHDDAYAYAYVHVRWGRSNAYCGIPVLDSYLSSVVIDGQRHCRVTRDDGVHQALLLLGGKLAALRAVSAAPRAVSQLP